MNFVARNALAAVAVGGVMTLLLAVGPDDALQEAYLNCPGSLETRFPDIYACGVRMHEGCSCARPNNPWSTVYWYFVPIALALVGIALFRARIALAALMLFIAVLISIGLFLAALNAMDGIGAAEALYAAVGLAADAGIAAAVYVALALCLRFWRKARHAT